MFQAASAEFVFQRLLQLAPKRALRVGDDGIERHLMQQPAVTMSCVWEIAPASLAARAHGMFIPSAIPVTISHTASPAVKCFSMCGATGMAPFWTNRSSGERFVPISNSE